MQLLTILDSTLPITNPVLKFLLILIIILITPILLNKVRIPPILGLIIAGVIIGPHGANLLLRDSGIILSGTAGLLYIMFLAGLEININDFKRNSSKSLYFGLLTFSIPMILGFFAGFFLLNYSILTSILLASMFASHTLIAYPIISKYNVTKNRAVNITVGGTLITDTLALLVLAIIVGITSGKVDSFFWVKLSISLILFSSIIIFLFPIISRWFFKGFEDRVSQYIFVLAMVFLGAFLAEIAGVEAIIGAFLTGLALNSLIPRTSPLMNRIEFVGNAIFIPFFLIGVGMLVDYKTFFQGAETIKVAAIMTFVATFSKFLASWITQKTFKLSNNERRLIFGLSNAQAAATLAAVVIGYNIIIGQSELGEPIRLFNDDILNGTIIMILVTCTISTFATQKGANRIAVSESIPQETGESEEEERFLISINNPSTIEELINLSMIIRTKEKINELYALNIIRKDTLNQDREKEANLLLEKAVITASSTDTRMHKLLRYNTNIGVGITETIKEFTISDLIIGLTHKHSLSNSSLGDIIEKVISKSNITTYIYKPIQPISTIKRQIIIIPKYAEHEIGFPFWLIKMWNLAYNTGAKLLFYGTKQTIQVIREVHIKHPIEADFKVFENWNDFLILVNKTKLNDNLIIILSRLNKISYHSFMENIPDLLNKHFLNNSYMLIYPKQIEVNYDKKIGYYNPSLLESIEKLDEIGRTILKLLIKK